MNKFIQTSLLEHKFEIVKKVWIHPPRKSFLSQISAAGTFYDISPNVLFRIKFPNVQHLFYTLFTFNINLEKRKRYNKIALVFSAQFPSQ